MSACPAPICMQSLKAVHGSLIGLQEPKKGSQTSSPSAAVSSVMVRGGPALAPGTPVLAPGGARRCVAKAPSRKRAPSCGEANPARPSPAAYLHLPQPPCVISPPVLCLEGPRLQPCTAQCHPSGLWRIGMHARTALLRVTSARRQHMQNPLPPGQQLQSGHCARACPGRPARARSLTRPPHPGGPAGRSTAAAAGRAHVARRAPAPGAPSPTPSPSPAGHMRMRGLSFGMHAGSASWERRPGLACRGPTHRPQQHAQYCLLLVCSVPILIVKTRRLGLTVRYSGGSRAARCSLRRLTKTRVSMHAAEALAWSGSTARQAPALRTLYSGTRASVQWPILSGKAGNARSSSRVVPRTQLACAACKGSQHQLCPL